MCNLPPIDCVASIAARSPVAVATASAAQTRSVWFFDNWGAEEKKTTHTHKQPPLLSSEQPPSPGQSKWPGHLCCTQRTINRCLVVWGHLYLKCAFIYFPNLLSVQSEVKQPMNLDCSVFQLLNTFSRFFSSPNLLFTFKIWSALLVPVRTAPPTFVIDCTYPLLSTSLDSKRQLRQSFHLPISLNSRLYPPPSSSSSSSSSSSFLSGHGSESENAREADQWETDVWSCIDGSSSSSSLPPSRPPLHPSFDVWRGHFQ